MWITKHFLFKYTLIKNNSIMIFIFIELSESHISWTQISNAAYDCMLPLSDIATGIGSSKGHSGWELIPRSFRPFLGRKGQQDSKQHGNNTVQCRQGRRECATSIRRNEFLLERLRRLTCWGETEGIRRGLIFLSPWLRPTQTTSTTATAVRITRLLETAISDRRCYPIWM